MSPHAILGSRFYVRCLTFVLIAGVIISIGTYFTALSQYPTADQSVTLERFQIFLKDFRSVRPADGSSISYLLVALPGSSIANLLDIFYQQNDVIIWNIRYTQFLPFAIAQILITLGLIFYLSYLVGLLAFPGRFIPIITLFSLIIILNFPMLKAIAKVLKYDALSTLFSAIAIVLYIGYRKFHGRPPSPWP